MYLWTSEAVSRGHPDKVADQIADALLDHFLGQNPNTRVASEVTILKDLILLSGEVQGYNPADAAQQAAVIEVVRRTVRSIGYDRPQHDFDARTCQVQNCINGQSIEIANAVAQNDGSIGAGDQGFMFGYATNETDNFMPLSHRLSFDIINLHQAAIDPFCGPDKKPNDDWGSAFKPDAKSQVTVEYNDNGKARRIEAVVLSTCHYPMSLNDIRGYVQVAILDPFHKRWGNLIDANTKVYINPAGTWNVGGPAADTGLSGRKIAVDQYGGSCPIGGGSFSGKDPTKVDRSGAYACRHLAKNIVAAGLASEVQLQVAYAIGVPEPVSLRVRTVGASVPDSVIYEAIRSHVDMTPKGIIERLGLRSPIYSQTASGGHFGREGLPWEKLDLVDRFRSLR